MRHERRKAMKKKIYDSQRETRVLLEHMNKGIDTIAEQHGDIINRLDNVESGFDTVKSELDIVKLATIENVKDIKELKAGQKNNSEDIKEIKVGYAGLKIGQEEIKHKLDTVIQNHEKRIS